jgi:hypothetical protein
LDFDQGHYRVRLANQKLTRIHLYRATNLVGNHLLGLLVFISKRREKQASGVTVLVRLSSSAESRLGLAFNIDFAAPALIIQQSHEGPVWAEVTRSTSLMKVLNGLQAAVRCRMIEYMELRSFCLQLTHPQFRDFQSGQNCNSQGQACLPLFGQRRFSGITRSFNPRSAGAAW